jgi:hypothetical protein
MQRALSLAIVATLTLVSGYADAMGFIHSARLWNDGRLIAAELGKSALGYAVGIIAYWIALRQVRQFGIVSAEAQTIGWFSVTIIGVAVGSGAFLEWRSTDKLLALAVVIGLAILLYRTGG